VDRPSSETDGDGAGNAVLQPNNPDPYET
jgi:hypothetical protein